MRRTAVLLLAVMMLFSACAQAEGTFRDLAARHDFLIGAPLSFGQMGNSNYLGLLSGEFASVTMTNEMKAYSLLDQKACQASADGMPVMNYYAADRMVGWARDNGLKVRGHVLVWDAYMPDWYFREGYDSRKDFVAQEVVEKRTESYITQVITHFEEAFPGTVYCWDVVNEAVGDSAEDSLQGDARHLRVKRSGQDNLFYRYMGPDYVEKSFLYARNTVEALGKDIRLYYNDYNAYFADKAAAILKLAESVNSYAKLEDGSTRHLMDGVGMQGYIGGYGTQRGCLEESHIDMIRRAIENYADQGFEVQITEMAVRNFEQAAAEKHAEFYGKLFAMLAELQKDSRKPLKAVSIWGLTDYPDEKPGTYVYSLNSPFGGLLTAGLEWKDAYTRVCEVLAE